MSTEILSEEFKPQFHHYLPRFIIRRWQQEGAKRTTHTSNSKKKGKAKRTFELVNAYNIKQQTLNIGSTDIGKTYGIVDMYKDEVHKQEAYEVETRFARLENDAAIIFNTLATRIKAKRHDVELRRGDVNKLRKFLFLMSYRSANHMRQFIEEKFDPATYHLVEKFRVQHSLPDIRSVWLHSMRYMLEQEHWLIPDDERIFILARMDYKIATLGKQLAFFEAPPETDFILTENALGLFEGVSTNGGLSVIELTRSFPISPRLVIFLRDISLMQEAARESMGAPARTPIEESLRGTAKSYFVDFPQTAAQITYNPPLPTGYWSFTETPSDCLTPSERRRAEQWNQHVLDGYPIPSRTKDLMRFDIHQLTKDQAEKVNNLRLEHTHDTVTYVHHAKLLQSIEYYENDEQLSGGYRRPYKTLKFADLKRQLQQVIAGEQPMPGDPRSYKDYQSALNQMTQLFEGAHPALMRRETSTTPSTLAEEGKTKPGPYEWRPSAELAQNMRAMYEASRAQSKPESSASTKAPPEEERAATAQSERKAPASPLRPTGVEGVAEALPGLRGMFGKSTKGKARQT